ncbi:Uncharacterized protein OBRU01_00098, partial [Operophtera brumata]
MPLRRFMLDDALRRRSPILSVSASINKDVLDTPTLLDTREGVTSHWSDPSTLGMRATFRSETIPAVLVITKLRLEGNEVLGGILGPYDEGRPIARVSWWKSHALLANSEARAVVTFKLQRSDYGTDITCQSSTDGNVTNSILTFVPSVEDAGRGVTVKPGPGVLLANQSLVLQKVSRKAAGSYEQMSYHWWFNSSAHSKHELTTSPLATAPNTPNKPSSVKACEITNVTYDSLTLNCTPGHDGGIRQAFLLQIFDMTTGLLLRNVSNDDPEFEVSGLSASNALGVSLTTVLIIVLGAVGVIAAMTALSAAVFCCRYCNKKGDYSSIRPLISKTPDKYDIPPNCERYYDHNIDPCNQYIQVRQMDYRRYPIGPMGNLGPSIQSLGPMSSLHVPNVGPTDCHRQYDK